MPNQTIRCDLHLHSSASKTNEEWYSKLFACPESYASPERQYELCKARGMSLVTLTDHDTIEGGLTLLGRPDFFLSEEVTTRFPESGCVVHVLAWGISPAQHERIQQTAPDIHRLVALLRDEQIAHSLAHPLLAPNWRLDPATLEQLLVLFPTIESVNGLTDRRITGDLEAILAPADGAALAALAARHGLALAPGRPGRHARSGGSDDHVHRRCGSVFTEVEGAGGVREFLDGVMAGAGRVSGEQGDLNAMALCVSHTTYHFLRARTLERPDYRDPFLDLIDTLSGRDPGAAGGAEREAFLAALLAGVEGAGIAPGSPLDLLQFPENHAPSSEDDARLVAALGRTFDQVLARSLEGLTAALVEVDLYRLFGAARDLAGALSLLAPYLFGADHFGRQYEQGRRVREGWSAWPLAPRPERLAIFSDSLTNVDGVASSCRRFACGAERAGKDVRFPHCGPRPDFLPGDGADDRLVEATRFASPFYRGMTFYLPSLVDTIDWVWRHGITHVELATPGPMGLVGLAAARLLRLPVTASYHTEVPELVGLVTGSPLLLQAARGYVRWFCRAVDRVFVFSEASRQSLAQNGVEAGKIELRSVAVNPEDFSPRHATPALFHGPRGLGDRPVVLSVGRLSIEKNLPFIIEAVGQLQHLDPAPVLVIVGDGPQRAQLAQLARSCPFVRLAGELRGEELRRTYASAQLFVFASQIDTLGLVTLEAMASGLPVLVPSATGIAGLIEHGFSGHVYDFSTEGLARALEATLGDREHMRRLGAGARRAVIDRWQRDDFESLWGAMIAPPPQEQARG